MKKLVVVLVLVVSAAVTGLADVMVSADGNAITATAADYVQDGLVMHLDGIENVAYGQAQDASSTVWHDLTGHGYDWTLASGTYSWTAKGLYLNGTGVAGSTTKRADDFKSNLVTVEFVCRNESEPYSIFFNPGLNENVLIYTGNDRRVGFWSSNLGVQAVYPGYRPAGDTNYSYSVVYDYHSLPPRTDEPSGVRDFMVGGVVQESDPLDNFLSINDGLPHLGGRTGSTNQRIAKGDLLAVRLYNRVLTDDERRTNAWVDSQRFGTPYFVAKDPKA